MGHQESVVYEADGPHQVQVLVESSAVVLMKKTKMMRPMDVRPLEEA